MKATPIPDTIRLNARMTLDYATCQRCGSQIFRGVGTVLWIHNHTVRIRCGERTK